ncbi:MAG: septal ring lytic transglycosylase RlpA family protein [Proteobacteria bacterium]|nr:septal ring lytic transglycosylase RlpA family protein [Pseudomonadota bacterium]
MTIYSPFFFKRTLVSIFMFSYVVFLTACGGISVAPTTSDAAPDRKVDVSNIPNAIPKNEAKSRYGNPKSYVVFSKRYYVMESGKGFIEKGIASWYGTKFHGKRTSSGETYDMYAMTAAHKNLPLPTYVKVTNLNNGRHIIVKVNDRGPFHENRIIDLSYTAAIKLDIVKYGTGLVEVRAIEPGQKIPANSGDSTPVKTASESNDKAGFYIQVGSFGQLINAENLRQKLGPIGDNLVKISQPVVSGDTLYRVRIGPLTDIDLADSIISKLVNFGVVEHRIVVN